jgi:single-stranded-DNA-specific exonuclease
MRWTLKPKPDTEKIANFAAELGVDLAISELLLQRGIDTFQTAKIFFRPSWSDLHDPFLMKDMAVTQWMLETQVILFAFKQFIIMILSH